MTGPGSRMFWQGAGGVAGLAEPLDGFGSALSAGDFDNDGFADLAVGVSMEDSGAGVVHTLGGSPVGLTGTASRLFRQGVAGVPGPGEPGDRFGRAMVAGDFDNDGFADLAVAAPDERIGSISFAGVVDVLYGSSGGLSGAGSQEFRQAAAGVPDSPEPTDLFGTSLAAGDFDRDGFADLAVGVPGEAPGPGAPDLAGAVTVLYGSAPGLTGAGSRLFAQGSGGVGGTPEFDDEFGRALAAGDFTDDGAADLAVGVPLEDIGTVEDAGAVNVLLGSATGLTGFGGRVLWQGSGGVPGSLEAFDWVAAALSPGDFNGDGHADLAAGIPREDVGAAVDAGALSVLPGTATGVSGATGRVLWQGAGGIPGLAESRDVFGAALVSGDQ